MAKRGLLDALRRIQGLGHEVREVALRYVAKAGTDWAMFERGSVRGEVTAEPVRPGRFTKTKVSGAALLDELLIGGDAFVQAPDHLVWAALLKAVRELNPRPRSARAINDAVCRAVLIRAGLDVPPWKLPNPGALIDTAPEGSSK